jgi:hypothetical protein
LTNSCTLRALQQLDDNRRTADEIQQVVRVVGRACEAGHRQPDAFPRQQLHRAQLVARARDRNRFVERKNAHHLELPHDRSTVKRDRRTDARDHGVQILEGLAVEMHRRLVARDVHVAAQWIDDRHLVAAIPACIAQPAGGVQALVPGQNRNLHF